FVAPDHDAGHSREGDAGNVEAAAGEPDLVPDRDGIIGNVRIVGDERLAGVGAIAIEHPVVAAAAPVAAGGAGTPVANARGSPTRAIIAGLQDGLLVNLGPD